jgi:tripartite-type tricarboxylate transporter receptor subunit TctC
VLPHIRSGALRALAVSSDQRISTLTDLPTVAESGVPGFETYQWYGIFVPRQTPAEIVTRLNQELAEIMTAPNITTTWRAKPCRLPPAGRMNLRPSSANKSPNGRRF